MATEPMMNAFIKFNKGVMRAPTSVRLWLMLLIVFNLVVPLFYLHRVEAQIILGAFLSSVVLMTILTGLSGFTRLIGLGHIFWIPLLYFLWSRLGQIPADELFGIWIRGLIGVNAISLVIDGVDVLRYIAGDRAETMEGL